MKMSIPIDDDHLVVFEQTTKDRVCPTCGMTDVRPISSTMTVYRGDHKHTVPCRAPVSYDEARAKAVAFAAEAFAGDTTGLPGL